MSTLEVERISQVATMLIRTCPQAVLSMSDDTYSMTPFHVACQANAHFRVLVAMLKVNPQLAAQECGETIGYINPLNSPVGSQWAYSGFQHCLGTFDSFEGTGH